MRETDYVELAFWAGWAHDLGGDLSQEQLVRLNDQMREYVSEWVSRYICSIQDQEIDSDV